MDFNEINEIIKKLIKSGAAEVSFETKELKLTVKNHPKYPPVINTPQPVNTNPQVVNDSTPVESTQAKKNTESIPDGLITVKSPMVGIFYRKPDPDKPPYVNVGDKVKKGTVLCLIEAMKLFNEIESEVSGKIVKTLVDDGTAIEYDQALFLIDPK